MRNKSTWAVSPPSPTRWAPDAWSIPLSGLVAVGVAACMLLPAIAYILVVHALGQFDPRHPTGQLLIAQLITYVPWAVFLVAVLPRLGRTTPDELGFRFLTARDVGIAAFGLVAMWLGTTVVGSLMMQLTHAQDTEAAIALLHDLHTPLERGLYVAIAVLFAPMLEELTFRVFLFNAFTRYTTVPLAALASSILFGLVHISPKSASDIASQLLTISVPLVIGGLVLAYVYATTRCYWASVLTHGCFNAVTVIAVLGFHAS